MWIHPMFFRREKPHQWTFEEHIAGLKQFGFEIAPKSAGSSLVKRGICGAVVEDAGGGKVKIGKMGVLMGSEIAHLVNGGYQMFLRTAAGAELPALAPQLKALHAFDEDLREGLGLTSLYNVALGTTCDDHLYDRLEDRDAPPHPKPWEHKTTP
ncbi:MAG: hypothetical protein ACRD5L_01120 [Bryobacteraceae bacterium]